MGCVGGSPRTRHTPRDAAARGARGSLWTRGESLLLLTLEQKKDKTTFTGPARGRGLGREQSLWEMPQNTQNFLRSQNVALTSPFQRARRKKEKHKMQEGE